MFSVPKGLKVYNIPKEVKSIGESARTDMLFNHPEEIIFENGGIEKIPDNYFDNFKLLKKLTLPNGIKILGNKCIDLTTVECNFPKSLEHLGMGMYPVVQKLEINTIDSLFESEVKRIKETQKKDLNLDNLAQQERILAENQVIKPIRVNNSEEIERLKDFKKQVINNQSEEEIEQNFELSM